MQVHRAQRERRALPIDEVLPARRNVQRARPSSAAAAHISDCMRSGNDRLPIARPPTGLATGDHPLAERIARSGSKCAQNRDRQRIRWSGGL